MGSFCYTDQAFRDTVTFLEEKRLDAEPYLGVTEPLEKVAEAFEALAVGTRSELKIMMTTGAISPLAVARSPLATEAVRNPPGGEFGPGW